MNGIAPKSFLQPKGGDQVHEAEGANHTRLRHERIEIAADLAFRSTLEGIREEGGSDPHRSNPNDARRLCAVNEMSLGRSFG